MRMYEAANRLAELERLLIGADSNPEALLMVAMAAEGTRPTCEMHQRLLQDMARTIRIEIAKLMKSH